MDPKPKFSAPAFINDIADKLGEVLKQSPAKDFEQNLRAGVTSMLGKLDIVTREEFDVQAEVLLRTREKLAQLEARLLQLETPGASDARLLQQETSGAPEAPAAAAEKTQTD
jgi:BMFP domain-containing protein YqiC